LKSSVYIAWAKDHAAARYNLANSGLLGCDFNDLAIALDDIALNGPNGEGFGPLKELIASTYGTTADHVVTAQGTSMANFLAMATVIERGDEVLIEQPAYEPMLSAAAYLGAEVKRFHRKHANGYQIDVDELKGLLTPRTRLVVLTSPHNPSGVVVEPAILEQIAEATAAVEAFVLLDEVYRDILFEDAPPSAMHLGPHFIATSSLTKSYGLSGLRCGWILCQPELAEKMRRMNDLFGVVGSMPSDGLAAAAFRQLETLRTRARSLIEPNTALVHQFLKDHEDHLECVVPPRSMVVFPRLKSGADSQSLHDLLRQSETSIVPGRFFEEPNHFRLGFAVRTEDVEIGLTNLSNALRIELS
jgi:aspartate/methionine/tyrosine aminotransferase